MTNEEIAREIGDAPITAIATGLLNLERLQENLRQMAATEPPTQDSTPTDEQERRKQFGARLRMIRTLRGLTQAEVAKVLGINKSTVTLYENGRTEPSLKNLVLLARTLNVSADWLLDLPTPKSE